MASLKRKARENGGVKDERDVSLTDSVLELSVTMGYLGSDVRKEEIAYLDSLLRDHCVAGVVALERGETEDHLHFQMVVRARCKNARSFGVLVQKYMGWFGRRGMSPVGKVTCKVLSNRLMHTFIGMIGYCLKDTGATHFEHCMHNISDDDVIAGKTLHTIYGREDAKRRVTLTNKNVTDRMYVWFKYRSQRQLIATFLTTLTDMIQSGIFVPSAAWIIPLNGQGMDHKRMTSLWKCITDPLNVTKTEIQDIFVKKRNFVKGRYYDDDVSSPPYVYEEEQQPTPLTAFSNRAASEMKPTGAVLKSALKPYYTPGRVSRVLFEEGCDDIASKKSVCFQDALGDYIPVKDNAKMVQNEYLNTTNAQGEIGRKLVKKSCAGGGVATEDVVDADDKSVEVIDLTSDSEEEPGLCTPAASVFWDWTMMRAQNAPRYMSSSFCIKEEPLSPASRCSG